MLKKAASVHVLTEFEADQARRYGVATRLNVVPSGISLEPEASKVSRSSRYGQSEHRFRLLFLGRVVPNKGPDLLIRAVAQLSRSGRNVSATIAGPCDADYGSALARLAAEIGVGDKITFAGLVVGAQKATALFDADIFVLPSQFEALSLALLEAMSWGLPIVITRQCNFPEAAAVGAGVEVDLEVGQLVSAIRKLMDSPGQLAEMGRAGRALVERKYTWESIAPKMLDLYERVAQSAPKRR